MYCASYGLLHKKSYHFIPCQLYKKKYVFICFKNKTYEMGKKQQSVLFCLSLKESILNDFMNPFPTKFRFSIIKA